MVNNMSTFVVDLIVKRYETSSEFKNNISTSRRKSIKIYDKILEYEIAEGQELINKQVKNLLEKGLIKVKWMDIDNIIESISFNIKDMEEIQKMSSIKSLKVEAYRFITKINNAINCISVSWIISYLSDIKKFIEKNKRCPSSLNIWFDEYLKCLLGINELIVQDNSMQERVFSKRYLGNSKLFSKKYKKKIISLIKKYKEDTDKDLSDAEILSNIGIESIGSDLYIKGKIIFNINGEKLDLINIDIDIGLSSEAVKVVTFDYIDCDKVLIYENKANFTAACKSESNSLIIFSSGYLSPPKLVFVRNLYKYINGKVEFYHSGDLDLGGLKIFNHIKEEAVPSLMPKDMNVDLYYKYLEFAEAVFDNKYLNKIKSLLNQPQYVQFYDLIYAILRERKILEQEAFLIY